jgi:MraZ protein
LFENGLTKVGKNGKKWGVRESFMSMPFINAAYTDTFSMSLDEKGRVAIPAEWRLEIYERYLYALPAVGCLRVYPASWLSRLQEEMRGVPEGDERREHVRMLCAVAQLIEWERDKQNRFMIKERLRRHARLKRNVVLCGRGDHFEIWAAETWKKQGELPVVEEILKRLVCEKGEA